MQALHLKVFITITNHSKTVQNYDIQYSVHLHVCKCFEHSLQTYSFNLHDDVKVSCNMKSGLGFDLKTGRVIYNFLQ